MLNKLLLMMKTRRWIEIDARTEKYSSFESSAYVVAGMKM